jgi:hypothetical protein
MIGKQTRRFRPYTVSTEYASIFEANYGLSIKLVEDKRFRPLFAALANASDRSIGEADLKLAFRRLLLSTIRFHYAQLDRSGVSRQVARIAARCFIGICLWVFRRPREIRRRDIIMVDEWYSGAIDTFYSRELLDGLEGAGTVLRFNFGAFRFPHVSFPFALRYAAASITALRFSWRMLAEYGVQPMAVVELLLFALMKGEALKKDYAPRAILSGNDNGFSGLMAKAAGARLVLVQNGMRDVHDVVGLACDAYVGILGEAQRRFYESLGANIGEYYGLGSIRLSNFLRRTTGEATEEWDVLYIGTGIFPSFIEDHVYSAYYSPEAELTLIHLINGLAEDCGLRVAAHFAYSTELEYLRAHGIISPQVTCLCREETSVYALMRRCSTVVTSFSTVGVEALALSGRAVFVNLSGNATINAPLRGSGLEFPGCDSRALASFIEAQRKAGRATTDIAPLTPDLAEKIASIVSAEAKAGQD